MRFHARTHALTQRDLFLPHHLLFFLFFKILFPFLKKIASMEFASNQRIPVLGSRCSYATRAPKELCLLNEELRAAFLCELSARARAPPSCVEWKIGEEYRRRGKKINLFELCFSSLFYLPLFFFFLPFSF